MYVVSLMIIGNVGIRLIKYLAYIALFTREKETAYDVPFIKTKALILHFAVIIPTVLSLRRKLQQKERFSSNGPRCTRHSAMPLSVHPSVCLPVCRSHLGQLCAPRLGQASRAVRTADPSAHGRRSAAIGGGISSRRAITCFKQQWYPAVTATQYMHDASAYS